MQTNPLVMAPIEAKKYQITVVAGKQITIDGVNFKFYGGKGWEMNIRVTESLQIVNS